MLAAPWFAGKQRAAVSKSTQCQPGVAREGLWESRMGLNPHEASGQMPGKEGKGTGNGIHMPRRGLYNRVTPSESKPGSLGQPKDTRAVGGTDCF